MSILSRLPNRQDLHRALGVRLRTKSLTSLLFVDIDNFKPINDTFGHDKGDERLEEIVSLIKTLLRNKGTIYRWGGDEFCILMRNFDINEAAGTAERLRRAIDALPLVENTIKNSASIGVICTEDVDVTNATGLIKLSDRMMYEAKLLRNSVRVWESETKHSEPRNRRTVANDLRSLFRRDAEIKIIYSELTLAEPVRKAIDSFFKRKEEREAKKVHFLTPTDPNYRPKLLFRGTRVACVCEVRGAAYLSYSLAQTGLRAEVLSGTSPLIRGSRFSHTFISVGAKSNQMTAQLLSNKNNRLVDIDLTDTRDIRFRSKSGKWLHPKRVRGREDYGVVVSIHPDEDPNKTWIACAGLGEFGTSGAAYFLAFRWWRIVEEFQKRLKELDVKMKDVKNKVDISTFACIVKTRADADDGTELFNFALSEDQWHEYPGPAGKS